VRRIYYGSRPCGAGWLTLFEFDDVNIKYQATISCLLLWRTCFIIAASMEQSFVVTVQSVGSHLISYSWKLCVFDLKIFIFICALVRIYPEQIMFPE
jgi:hypothetical protein